MRFKVQLVVCAEDGQEDTVHELTVLDKPCQRLEHLSLTLAEAKQLLTPRPQVTSHTRRVPHVQFECPIGRDMGIDQRRESAEVVW
jgi:hypothetical protein